MWNTEIWSEPIKTKGPGSFFSKICSNRTLNGVILSLVASCAVVWPASYYQHRMFLIKIRAIRTLLIHCIRTSYERCVSARDACCTAFVLFRSLCCAPSTPCCVLCPQHNSGCCTAMLNVVRPAFSQ